MNKVILFINGEPPKVFPDLSLYDWIFCTDGAYKYLIKHNIWPDTVSGDFDSIQTSDVEEGIEIVETPDQNLTDFEKALQLIIDRGFEAVDVYGSSGKEHDHFLGNLNTAVKFKSKITLMFHDDFSFYFFADKKTVLEGYKDKIISLIPFPTTENIVSKGVMYPLENENLDLTARIGSRNVVTEDKVEISFENGNLLLFVSNKQL